MRVGHVQRMDLCSCKRQQGCGLACIAEPQAAEHSAQSLLSCKLLEAMDGHAKLGSTAEQAGHEQARRAQRACADSEQLAKWR